jgi:methionyl-tRNA formyltransferase
MIVVLTYDHPHRKTQDLIFKLLAQGYKPLIIATEWEERKSFVPIISHRPANPVNMSLTQFCENVGLKLTITTKINLYFDLLKHENIDFLLLATGNIIDDQIVTKYKVINSHPGYLPDIKGLDALKWAILHKEKIGVTTHFVNIQIDGGIIIERQIVPLYFEDTFHNLAYRQYEMEVDMLVNSINNKAENTEIGESKYQTFRRMPHRLEYQMMEKFEELRKESGIKTKSE